MRLHGNEHHPSPQVLAGPCCLHARVAACARSWVPGAPLCHALTLLASCCTCAAPPRTLPSGRRCTGRPAPARKQRRGSSARGTRCALASIELTAPAPGKAAPALSRPPLPPLAQSRVHRRWGVWSEHGPTQLKPCGTSWPADPPFSSVFLRH